MTYGTGCEVRASDSDRDRHTEVGDHVNLVTHAELLSPEEFLYDTLDDRDDVDWENEKLVGAESLLPG